MSTAIKRESEKLTSLTILECQLETRNLRTLKKKVDGRVKKASGILIKKFLSR
jgi:hypothetical protein